MSYWKCNNKYYVCSEFINDRDYVLRPIHFPFDQDYLLVPNGQCKPDCMEVTEAEFMSHKIYNIEYDGTLQTRPDMKRALLDIGNPPEDFAIVYSGKTVTLSGDGKIDVPINATYEELIPTKDQMSQMTNVTLTVISDTEYKNDCIDTRFGLDFLLSKDYTNEPIVTLSFFADYMSGLAIINKYYSDGGWHTIPRYEIKMGWNEITIPMRSLGGKGTVRLTSSWEKVTTSVIISNISVKLFSKTEGSVTHFDYIDNKFKQVGANGIGSVEQALNGNFEDGQTNWENLKAGCTITDKFTSDGTSNYWLAEGSLLSLIKDKTYLLSYEVDNITHGWVGVLLNVNTSLVDNTFVDTNGVHPYFFTANETVGVNKTVIRTTSSFTGDVDNISVRESLPLSTKITFDNGTYGAICVLHTNHFSQDDLDEMNKKPELLIEWSFGKATLPSGIIMDIKDKIYYPSNGDMYEIRSPLDKELIVSDNQLTDIGGTLWNRITATEYSTEVNNTQFNMNFGLIENDHTEPLVLLIFYATIESGRAYINKYYSDGGWHTIPQIEIVNGKNMLVVKSRDYKTGFVRIGAYGTVSVKIKIDKISVNQIKSSVIKIQGTHDFSNTSEYGIQEIALEFGKRELPKGTCNNICGGDDGRYIELPLGYPKKYLVTKCIDKIEGKNTAVTVYNCDGTQETIKA